VDDLDISHEMDILYRLAAQGEEPPRSPGRPVVKWLSVAALTLAVGWGGAAYAARSGYTISSGETLYQIAKRHFGSGPRWVENAALNKIDDPARVRAGQVITLPDPHERINVDRAVASQGARNRTAAKRAAKRAGWRQAAADASQGRARTRTQTRAQDRHAAIGRTRDGVRLVPAGEVLLELPARRPDVRTARAGLARPVNAERVRPQQEFEEAAPLPAPPFPSSTSDSPWRALDGAAFLLGALGITGLLARGRSQALKARSGDFYPELPPFLAPERA